MRPRATIAAVRPIVCDTGHGRTFLFVVVETDAGVFGVGEGSQNDQDAAVVANIRQLTPQYVGQDPLDLIEARGRVLTSNRTGRALSVAVSALEQALWDLVGKLLEVPLYQLLGGSCHGRLRCNASIGAGQRDWTAEGVASEAMRCVADGFDAVKVVPFHALPPALDGAGLDTREGRKTWALARTRVAAAREAVGPDVDILIECGLHFDRATAMRFAREIESYDVYWLEAPLLWDDAGELSLLRGAISQRLASGETEHGRRAYRALIEAQAVDVLQPDVKWTGGILETKKIAAWAEAYQLGVAPHNNSGPVATAASAHLSATLPNFLLLEVPSHSPAWEVDLLRGTGVVQRGCVTLERLRERSGLGIEFDEAVARRHEVTL